MESLTLSQVCSFSSRILPVIHWKPRLLLYISVLAFFLGSWKMCPRRTFWVKLNFFKHYILHIGHETPSLMCAACKVHAAELQCEIKTHLFIHWDVWLEPMGTWKTRISHRDLNGRLHDYCLPRRSVSPASFMSRNLFTSVEGHKIARALKQANSVRTRCGRTRDFTFSLSPVLPAFCYARNNILNKLFETKRGRKASSPNVSLTSKTEIQLTFFSLYKHFTFEIKCLF